MGRGHWEGGHVEGGAHGGDQARGGRHPATLGN